MARNDVARYAREHARVGRGGPNLTADTCAVVIAEGVRNGPERRGSRRRAGRRPSGSRASRASSARPTIPRIAAWRAAFSAFGAKPSRYPSSAESLLARVLKGEPVPRINALVDTYNAISLRHAIPDRRRGPGPAPDALRGDLRLVRAAGDELFDGDERPRPARSSGATTPASPAGAGTGARGRGRG